MSYSVDYTNMSGIAGAIGSTSTPYTYTYSNVASAGAVLTSNGTGSSSWATISADPNLQGNTLEVKGDANISGELTVQGVKLSDRLDKIEERLGILRPNIELEEKWDNLRALRNAYLELEAEIKEKEAMWGILKR
jgi:hypothetical protein